MISPYKMVVINLILSLLIGLSVLFYRYVYPKKKINLFILLIVISLLPLISIFRSGTYESGDMSINAVKTMAMYDSLSEGNFFPQWAGELNATYGYPLFVFTYPLPYYITSLFHFIGFGFIDSVKAFLFFSFVLSGTTMYFWMKNKFGKMSGFIASIFYLFAPYHLLDMHFRVDIGECMSFVFIPLCFMFIDRILEKKKLIYVFLEAISLSLLILSHQAVSLFIFIFLCLYILINFIKEKNVKVFILSIESIFLGLLLSMFYWLPVMFMGQFTHFSSPPQIYLPQIWEFFISPWRNGLLFQGPTGQLSPVVGYTQWVIIVLSIIFVSKKNGLSKKNVFNLKIFLLFFFIVFILMTSYSSAIWNLFSFFKKIEFSTRLLSLEVFFTSVLAGVVITFINRRWFLIIISILAIGTTILNWGNRGTVPFANDQVLRSGLPLSTAAAEGLGPAAPKWTDPKKIWMDTLPKSNLEILRGKGNVVLTKKTNVLHQYKIISQSDLIVKENTVFFPGWNVKINNRQTKINYQDNKYPGIIIFDVPKGENTIEVYYENTDIVKFARLVSLVTLIFISIYLGLLLTSPKL